MNAAVHGPCGSNWQSEQHGPLMGGLESVLHSHMCLKTHRCMQNHVSLFIMDYHYGLLLWIYMIVADAEVMIYGLHMAVAPLPNRLFLCQ